MENTKVQKINKFLMSLPGFDKIKSDIDFFAFIKKHKKQLEYGGNEIFLLVNSHDNIRRDKKGLPLVAYRKDCHQTGSNKYIHRGSNFFVTNKKGEILLSKRANNKDTYPGYWEIGGGHCGLLSYDVTLKKEIKEELGILSTDIDSTKKIMKSLIMLPIQQEYVQFYEINLKKGTKIHIDNKEVKKNIWYTIETIIKSIQNNDLLLIPDQKISLLQYLITKNNIKYSKIIKDMLKKQKEICKKENIHIKKNQIF